MTAFTSVTTPTMDNMFADDEELSGWDDYDCGSYVVAETPTVQVPAAKKPPMGKLKDKRKSKDTVDAEVFLRSLHASTKATRRLSGSNSTGGLADRITAVQSTSIQMDQSVRLLAEPVKTATSLPTSVLEPVQPPTPKDPTSPLAKPLTVYRYTNPYHASAKAKCRVVRPAAQSSAEASVALNRLPPLPSPTHPVGARDLFQSAKHQRFDQSTSHQAQHVRRSPVKIIASILADAASPHGQSIYDTKGVRQQGGTIRSTMAQCDVESNQLSAAPRREAAWMDQSDDDDTESSYSLQAHKSPQTKHTSRGKAHRPIYPWQR